MAPGALAPLLALLGLLSVIQVTRAASPTVVPSKAPATSVEMKGTASAAAATGTSPHHANATIIDAIKSGGYTDCLALLKAAGAQRHASNPRTTATVLCPTNQAIKSFLSSMGLTFDDLKQRPDLVDKLVAYHIVPRARAAAQRLKGKKAGGGGKHAGSFAVSGDPHYLLRFSVDPKTGGVLVMDSQGNVARVVKEDVDAGGSVVHGIDRVLMSGEYFPTLKAYGQYYLGNFSKLVAALNASGLGESVGSNKWNGTLFAPLDAALAGIELRLPALSAAGKPNAAEVQKLRAAVEYTQLPDFKEYPSGFSNGTKYGTRLAGHKLSVTYFIRNASKAASRGSSTARVAALEGRVVPEPGSPGKPAAIGLPNVYVAKGVVHGVDGVLLPAPAVPAGATKGTAGRRLLRGGPGGGFSGAGAPHAGGGGWGNGGGGRAFDPSQAMGDVRDRSTPAAATPAAPAPVDAGLGYTDAALAAGAAVGAEDVANSQEAADLAANQDGGGAAAPAADYSDAEATAQPNDAAPGPGMTGPTYGGQQQQQQQQQAPTCINCCIDCVEEGSSVGGDGGAPMAPPPAPAPVQSNEYEDANGRL